MVVDNRRVQQILYPEMNFLYFILFYGILSCVVHGANIPPRKGGILNDANQVATDQGGGAGPLAGQQFVNQRQNIDIAGVLPLKQFVNIPPGGPAGDGRHDAAGRPVGGRRNIMLATHPDCEEDVQQLCDTNQLRKNNFAVLDCLQGDIDVQSKVSEKCQNLIYHYKRNLTKDDRFETGASEVCHSVFEQISECKNLPVGEGKRIPCLIEHMDNITDNNCHRFLSKMANIVFGDYNLVWHFHEHCGDDISTYQCGRLDDNDGRKPHMQGNTILCLARKITILKAECKKQVLRVAELQSDDYHLDRPLYYACRDSREYFCENVHAGSGKVFDCLFKHKSSPGMADECKDLLTVRQQLIAEDVKVKKTFFEACRKDIRRYSCLIGDASSDRHAARSNILLCLESHLKSDQTLAGECVAEMTLLRKSLMEDYQITPEIVSRCDHEIQHFCNNGLDRGGKTLHCLMENANPRERQRKGGLPGQPEFRVQCRAAIEDLLKEADVGEDFTVDKVLADACQNVLETDCKDVPSTGVINCLMEKVDSDHMTDECEDRLLEIQYFLVRDFRLDPELYSQCHSDAVLYCHASEDWVDVHKQTVEESPMVFSCLYRHMKNDESPLKKGCVHEIRHVMRRRAKRIDLEPDIEDSCLKDLGALCSDLEHYGKGKEMSCLQDNLEAIEDEDCEKLVREFTEDEDEDLDLDTVLMRACTPMIKKFCDELLKHDAKADEVMDCLVESKNHHEMNDKCRAGIEHHQVIQLKDYRFSHRFKEACKGDVIKQCGEKHKKADIVACLSEIVRDDVLMEAKNRVSLGCQQQLRVEILTMGETIELDPRLKEACSESIQQLCADKHAGNSEVIECLRSHPKKLTASCHRQIFQRELDEAVQGGDFLLFKECKQMIKTYCRHKEARDVFDCLKNSMNSDGFDTQCRSIVLRRAMQETRDYRLNPSLAKSCRLDIPKFCKEQLSAMSKEVSNTEYEGKVINCLKIQFIKKQLSRECHTEIKSLVKDTQLDINMDPVLMHACEKYIHEYCSPEIDDIESNRIKFVPHDTGDKVRLCLLDRLMDGKISQISQCGREIARTIEEAHVDVNIDPQLNTACQQELLQWCRDVPSGEGKIFNSYYRDIPNKHPTTTHQLVKYQDIRLYLQEMSCLLSLLEDSPYKLKPRCNTVLTQRRTLWEYAAKYAPAESLSELSQQVMTSPAKSYLLGLLMTIVGVIFIVGITCGRVTKRVTREQKTK